LQYQKLREDFWTIIKANDIIKNVSMNIKKEFDILAKEIKGDVKRLWSLDENEKENNAVEVKCINGLSGAK